MRQRTKHQQNVQSNAKKQRTIDSFALLYHCSVYKVTNVEENVQLLL